jgi:hypothetical protein
MRIENALPSFFYTPQITQPVRQPVFNEPAQIGGFNSPAASVELSPQALAANMECETCNSRRYVDQSDDSSVSFQTPTHISPGQSASLVMAHEREHVANEQARADREGNIVVSQTVSLQVSNCPECNRMYVSGGSTRTITVSDNNDNQASNNPASRVNLLV